MKTPTNSNAGEVVQPRMVHLIQCGRRDCSHVLIEDERQWVRNGIGKTAICPKCGNDDFYTLNEAGQKLNMSQMDHYRNGLDPITIKPSPRMGPKMTRRILAAKRRALEVNH